MRILLVEDEADLGTALKRTLNQHKYLVDWVQDGDEAWDYLESQWTEYTVAIIDWMLPGLSGIELIKRLRSQHHSLPVLMLTAKDSLEDKVIGLDAGADDYLVKPFGMIELLARIRALQRRVPQLQLPQLAVGNFILDYGNFTVSYQDCQMDLTTKEFQLLEYFLKHPNQILSSDRLRYYLWEISAEPTSNVVAAQVRLLRRKLESIGCVNGIETVYGMGYRFNLTDESKSTI